MMNKVLISLYVPMFDKTYDVFIPVNEIMWKINKLIVKNIYDLNDECFDLKKNFILINVETGQIYSNNEVVINTDIRNYTKMALLEI